MKKIILFTAAAMMAAVTFAQTPTVSASKVTMKYCKTTYGTVNIGVREAGLPVTYDGFTFTAMGTYVRKLVNSRGCDSVVTYILGKNTVGMLPGKFTINSNGDQIQFSKGNLLYRASNGIAYPNEGCLQHMTKEGYKQGEFKFADTQYFGVGNTSDNGSPSATATTWIDMFAHGNSGYGTTKPYDRSSYYSGNSYNGTQYDWGVYNQITGGGTSPDLWRTLTKEEWNYIISDRPNASNKRAYGSINGVKGKFLLPDDWTLPQTCSFSANNANNYTLEQWADMEAAGAVFIICDYYAQAASGSLSGNGVETFYRSSGDGGNNYFGYNWYGNNGSWNEFNVNRHDAAHVRLVCDVEE